MNIYHIAVVVLSFLLHRKVCSIHSQSIYFSSIDIFLFCLLQFHLLLMRFLLINLLYNHHIIFWYPMFLFLNFQYLFLDFDRFYFCFSFLKIWFSLICPWLFHLLLVEFVLIFSLIYSKVITSGIVSTGVLWIIAFLELLLWVLGIF